MRTIVLVVSLSMLLAAGIVSVANATGGGTVGAVAPRHLIKDSYAKRLASRALRTRISRGRWNLRRYIPRATRLGPQRLYWVGSKSGQTPRMVTVNPVKGKGQPTGLRRVAIELIRLGRR